MLPEGKHEISYDGSQLAPGVYVYILTLYTHDDVLMQRGKMLIIK